MQGKMSGGMKRNSVLLTTIETSRISRNLRSKSNIAPRIQRANDNIKEA